MKVNESETVADKAYTLRSLFFCLHLPSFTWELEENTIPWVVFGITVFFFSLHRPAERFRDHSREQEETTAKSVDSIAA